MSILFCIVVLIGCYALTFVFIKKPIYKRDIIDKVIKDFRKGKRTSLCALFYKYLDKYNVEYEHIQDVFPLFTYENALKKTNATDKFLPYWWDPADKQSRFDFLYWLKDQYNWNSIDLRDTKK